jgi:hypothetical protein
MYTYIHTPRSEYYLHFYKAEVATEYFVVYSDLIHIY